MEPQNTRSPKPKTSRLLSAWVAAVVATGVILAGFGITAPRILERDKINSAAYYNDLASDSYKRAGELPEDQSDRKRNLLKQAAEYLEIAHNLQPDVDHYYWFLALARYSEALLSDPIPTSTVLESISVMKGFYDSGTLFRKQAASILANHFLKPEFRDDENAVKWLDRMIQLDPKDQSAYVAFVHLFWKRDEHKRAIEVLRRKERVLPLTPEDRNWLAQLYLRLDDYPRALDVLKQIFRGGSSDADHRLMYGIALAGVGRAHEAILPFGQYLSTLSPGEDWPDPEKVGVARYPSELYPACAYALLEGYLDQRKNQ